MLVVVTVTEIFTPLPDCGYLLESLTVIVAFPGSIAVTVNDVAPDAGETVATPVLELLAQNVPL
jgi:hypothetical protein